MRCDSHIHIVGPPDLYPLVPGRTYVPSVATLGDIRRIAAPQQVARFVIVQPSFYGADNTLLLEGLDELGAHGRGVAVVEPDHVPVSELEAMHLRGVRGLRLNLYTMLAEQATASLLDRFDPTAAVARRMGWHVEVIAPIAVLAAHAAMLAASDVPVVIDHYGLHEGVAPDDPAGVALLDLLRSAHVWMKLSAPYRNGPDPLALHADPAWAAAVIDAAPDRCVWGSDWPHTPVQELQKGGPDPLPYRALDYAELVNGFLIDLGSVERAERIMGENPARLYEF